MNLTLTKQDMELIHGLLLRHAATAAEWDLAQRVACRLSQGLHPDANPPPAHATASLEGAPTGRHVPAAPEGGNSYILGPV